MMGKPHSKCNKIKRATKTLAVAIIPYLPDSEIQILQEFTNSAFEISENFFDSGILFNG